jgi:putative ABC transport system permease protein
MNFVALRMLMGDRLKYVGLVAGLAFAALLVTQQASIFNGYIHRMAAWIRDTGGADLWIMDPQTNHTDDAKRIVDTALQRVRSVDGVEWAVPMFKGFLSARLPDGRLQQVRVVGIDDATMIGGPPRMVEGELADLRGDRAVLVNEADLGKKLLVSEAGVRRPMRVGDRLDINDNEVRVAGVYAKGPEFFWEPMVYTTYSRALRMAPAQRKQLQFVLAKVRPGSDTAKVAADIRAATGLAAYTGDEFAWVTMWYIMIQTGILVNFGITIALGFVIGVLVSALLLYTFMIEQSRNFGALKAMGVTNRAIVRMVAVQVLTVGSLGFGIGVGAAVIGGGVLAKADLAFRMVWQIPLIGAGAILICCLVAGILSLARVLRLEPAIVFKGAA